MCKQTLKIRVEESDKRCAGAFKELLRNSIDLDDSVRYDYNGLVDGLHLLYPNKEIVIHLSIL